MHLSADDISRYQARQLTPAEILRVRSHADDCEACRAQLGGGLASAAALRAEWAPHPDEQELVFFALRRELTPERRAAIAAHVSECTRCRADVADMTPMAPAKPSWNRWWLVAAAAALLLAVLTPLVLRQRAPEYIASVRDGVGVVGVTRSNTLDGLAGVDPVEQRWMADVLRSGRFEVAEKWAASKPALLRGPDEAPGFRVIGPVNVRLLADRPEFRWEPAKGATGYRVTVFNEQEQVQMQSEELRGTAWTPLKPLPRGVRLGWQVTATVGGESIIAPAASEARVWFSIMSADAEARILAAKSGANASHLRLAVLYGREGLVDEARRELDALESLNPNSELIRKLRLSLQ